MANGTKKRILIIEDDIDTIEVFKSILEAYGYSVCAKEDPLQGAISFQSDTFDMVLIDYLMPKMNGIEFLRRVELNDTPVMMITGFGCSKVKENCIKLGATAYMEKPVSLEKLVNKISEIFEEKGVENLKSAG